MDYWIKYRLSKNLPHLIYRKCGSSNFIHGPQYPLPFPFNIRHRDNCQILRASKANDNEIDTLRTEKPIRHLKKKMTTAQCSCLHIRNFNIIVGLQSLSRKKITTAQFSCMHIRNVNIIVGLQHLTSPAPPHHPCPIRL